MQYLCDNKCQFAGEYLRRLRRTAAPRPRPERIKLPAASSRVTSSWA